MKLNGHELDEASLAALRLLVLPAAATLGWLIHAMLMRTLKRLFALRPYLSSLLAYVNRPVCWLLILCTLELALPFLVMPERMAGRGHHLLYILIILTLGWLLTEATLGTSEWFRQRYSISAEVDNLHFRSVNTQLRVFTHVAIFLIILLTAIAIIMTIPNLRNLGMSLFASAGAAGIVLGLAAGPILSNLFAGIQLAVTQPVRIGDQIAIENASGIVEEIDSTYVVIRLWDYRRLIVPLNYFIQNRFQNWTHTPSESFIGTVVFYVDMTTAIEPLRQALAGIAETLPEWDRRICRLDVTDIKDNKMVEMKAFLSAHRASAIYPLQCKAREKLLALLQQPKT